jgi:hypothetical protein
MNALLKLTFRYLSVSLFIFISSTLLGQESLNIQLVPKFYTSGYNISCHGLNNGAISSQISGGTQPYTFNWSNGQHVGKIDHLTAGTYSLTVTDASSPVKTATQSITIYEPSTLNAIVNTSNYGAFEVSNPAAADGSIDIQVNGGAGAFSIVWNNGSTQPKLSNLNTGNYTYTLTDESGCVKQGSVQLTAPPSFSANVTVLNHIECGDDLPASAYVSISGGVPPYVVKWGTGSAGDTAHYLNPGIQEVYIQDAIGGVIHPSFEIVRYEKPKFNLQSSSYSNGFEVSCYNCYNGQIEVVSSNQENGPYTYVWNTGATSSLISGLGAGNYSVTVRDARNCAVTAEMTLNAPERDDWTMGGNAGTNPETQFIGTSDATDVVFKTNNSEALRLASNQNIGVGTTSPTAKIDVAGDVRVRSNLKVDSLAFLPDSIGATYRILMVDNEGNIMRGPISDLGLGQISGTVATECPDVKVSAEASWLNPRSAATNGANKDLVFTYAQVGIKTHCPNTDLDVRGTTYSDKIQVGNFDAESTQALSVLGTSQLKSDSESLLTLDHTFTGPWNVACAIKLRNELSKAISVSMVSSNGSSNEETETIRFLADGQTHLGATNSTARAYQLELYPKTDRNGLLVNVNTSIDGGFGIVSKVNAAHAKALVVTQTTDAFDAPTDEKFVVFGDGHVTIGTNGWFNSMLAVEGSIGCRGIKVLAQPNTLPDFVFQTNYILPSIDSVAAFINSECHLPGMSSALEVETAKEGVDLYTLQAQHLEQTERLYLYIIDLEKRLKKAEEELTSLKTKGK